MTKRIGAFRHYAKSAEKPVTVYLCVYLKAQTRRPSYLSLRAVHFSAFNLGNQTNMNEINAAYSTHGGEEWYMEGFGGKHEGKRPLARPRRRWKNIKMNLQEKGWELY